MSYLALYRKYRPDNFSDLVGQSEIVDIIKNEIIHQRISHAYLFSGPRGTGKTSTAKIIAKMINCENLSDDGVPCGKCASCINFNSSSDIVEIDAASNNGVDEIRNLRDKVNLVPTYGKYKVYIIDEVHMLTTQAFNALLKTLEEPPAHIVFILATTEFYKIPITVVSRCQKFQFLKFSVDDIVNRLNDIALKENITVNDDVLHEIARLSDGGMRDAINMLDQLSSYSDSSLSIDDVYKLNGVVSYKEFYSLLKNIYDNNSLYLTDFVEKLDQSGKSIERFVIDFLSFIKDILVYKNTGKFDSNLSDKNGFLVELSDLFDNEQLYYIISFLNDLALRLKNSFFAKILLITDLMKLSSYFNKKIVENSNFNSDNSQIVNINNTVQSKNINNKINSSVTKISDKERKVRINNAFATASKELKENFVDNWSLVEDKLSNDDSFVSITGMMNDVSAMVVGDGYVLFVASYDSLLDRLFENIDLIEKLLKDVYNTTYKAVFLLKDEWNYEKDKYVSSLKSGKKYVFINDDMNDSSSQLNEDNVDDNDVKKIASILGSDIISYE